MTSLAVRLLKSAVTTACLFGFVSVISGCGEAQQNLRKPSEDAESLPVCAPNSVTTANCKVEQVGMVVSNQFGSPITTWTNASASQTVEASVPNGFYANQRVNFSDSDLLPANIASGVEIFGVTGNLTSAYAACSDDSLNVGFCTTASSRYVTAINGAHVTTWLNLTGDTTVEADIPTGFYSSRQCQLSDSDLIAGNIRSGENIFGVVGTLVAAASSCTDDTLNASQCTTQASRYVTSTAGANITSWSNASHSTTISSTIPDGYYSSKSVSMADADLLAANIKSGVDIFGVTGTMTAPAAACTDNASNASACTTAASRYVTGTAGANISVPANASSASIPVGFYGSGLTVSLADTDLVAGNIKSGVTIHGVTGNYTGGAAPNCNDYTSSTGLTGLSNASATVYLGGARADVEIGYIDTLAAEWVKACVSGNGSPTFGSSYSLADTGRTGQVFIDGTTVMIKANAPAVAGTSNTGTVTFGTAVSKTYSVTYQSAGSYVFMTTAAYTGSQVGSLANADSICQTLANSSTVLPAGTYRAVLSDNATAASSRLSISYPIATSNGRIFEDTNFFQSSGIDQSNYSYDKNGVALSHSDYWTGSTTTGARAANNCSNWTSDATQGARAIEHDGGGYYLYWSDNPCGWAKPLLCIKTNS